MARSLRDAAFALDPSPTPGGWAVRKSVSQGIWPPLAAMPAVSVRELLHRFASAGAALRALASDAGDVWKHVDRGPVVAQIRDRLRDPAIMRQQPTDLCGPFSILVEFVRRHPVRYVNGASELLANGTLTTFGDTIEADDELRGKTIAMGGSLFADTLSDVDWIYAATMREAENITEDIDDAQGLEAMTLWGAMALWTRDILGLSSHWETCFNSGELDALLTAQDAIDAGGVAFFLVDSNLIKDGGDDTEEDMHWQSTRHKARKPLKPPGPFVHSEDDAFPPDHWVVYLGGLTPRTPSEEDTITLKLWSWGKEYTLSGTADAFGEYLYAVVTGRR